MAATSWHIAEEAAALITVDYEVLPAVMTAQDAMREDAPILHERLMPLENPNIRPGGLREEDDPGKGTNVANHFVFEIGDVAQGFRDADVIVEREFHTAAVHQGYIEPQSATALWSADGSLTIWCSSQGHFAIRDQASRILGLPVSKVKVIPMEIGGGFGAKTLIYLETGRCAVVEENRAPCEACHEPDRSIPRHGSDIWDAYPCEDRRDERWADHCRRRHVDL